ncbi:MAG: lipoprotein [Gammaproteobacteria bacterium]
MRTLLPVVIFVGVFSALSAGCGQKGPLYLPVTPPRTIPRMPPAATTARPAATALPPTQAQPSNPPPATTNPQA